MRLFQEHRRKRALNKYFKIRYFRERHEVYLRMMVVLRMLVDKGDGHTWRPSGMTVRNALFEAPGVVQVDDRLVARMLEALVADGLIEKDGTSPRISPKWMGWLYARYRVNYKGIWFLDQWWVQRTLDQLPKVPEFDVLILT